MNGWMVEDLEKMLKFVRCILQLVALYDWKQTADSGNRCSENKPLTCRQAGLQPAVCRLSGQANKSKRATASKQVIITGTGKHN